jgi:hypothetical protein
MNFVYCSVLLLLKLVLSLINPLCAQFIDISGMLGDPISVNYGSPNGNGLSFYDFNHDGWDDLTISRGSQMPLFFENQNGTFVPASFSIPTPTGKQFMMLLWVDLNNDGFEDLFISKFDGPIELWINDGNFNFTNIAPQSGIAIGNYNYNGSAIADYNKDGCLDLYIGKFYEGLFETGPHTLSRLYRSNCDGTYTDVTESAGVVVPTQLTFQPVFFDYNNDGWDDLYLINEMDYYQNQLFKNNGDGTFSDVSDESGAGIFIDAMSGTVGDFNNDNHLDVLVTNRPGTGGNYMMVNQGDNTFENQAEALGFGLGYQSWGSVWLDYDNDSWQDVFVSLPFPYQMPGNRFYVNQQGQGFTDERDALGFGTDNSDTYTCARGDINNDGYFDLAHSSWHTSSFKLYQNQGGVNNYLSVSLQGTHSNRNAIGSRIHCFAGGHHYTRYTHCGANLLGQDSRKEIFGLGNFEIVDSLVIDWSRGTREVYYNIAVNQHLFLIEGSTLSQPFDIGFNDDLYLCEGDSLILDAGEFESYQWNTGENTRHLTVFNPGIYTVSVTNQFGFSIDSNPIEVQNAPSNELQILESHISCFGAMDGQVEIFISNSPAQSFVWNSGDTLQMLSNLENGFYSFMGTDSYGCAFIGNAYIDEPAPLVADITTFNPTCFGFNDGQITIITSGGTAPYITEIDGFLLNELPAGIYNLQITDYNGCVLLNEAEIIQPEELSLVLEVTNIFETDDFGTASLSVFGGTGNHYIIWSTGLEDVYEISNLNAGEYWVLVSDENDCSVQHNFEVQNTTNINQNLKSNFAVYPNPFDNCFWVNASPGTSFSLYNNQGRLAKTFKAVDSVTTICLSELGAGLYTLVSISANDIQRIKLIKSN